MHGFLSYLHQQVCGCMTTMGFLELQPLPLKQARLLPCVHVAVVLVARRDLSGFGEVEGFLSLDNEALLGHAAPACLFPLFALLIISDTELLLGSGRAQGHAERDCTACDRTGHALSFGVAVSQGPRNRMQSPASRLFKCWLFFEDSDSWFIKGIYGGSRAVCSGGDHCGFQYTLTRSSDWREIIRYSSLLKHRARKRSLLGDLQDLNTSAPSVMSTVMVVVEICEHLE